MKLKLHEVLDLKQGIEKIMNLRLKATLSYKLIKILKVANEEFKVFMNLKNDALKKYSSTPADEGGNIMIKPDDINFEKFKIEVNELASMDVDIPIEKKISIKEFGTLEFEASVLLNLDPILKD